MPENLRRKDEMVVTSQILMVFKCQINTKEKARNTHHHKTKYKNLDSKKDMSRNTRKR